MEVESDSVRRVTRRSSSAPGASARLRSRGSRTLYSICVPVLAAFSSTCAATGVPLWPGLVCTFATTGITLAAPLVLQYAIDDLTAGRHARQAGLYGGALLAIGVVGGLFRFWTRRILIGASRDIEYDIRNDFFAHLQTLPLAYFQAHRTGDLMSRATNDLNAVRMMIGPSIMYSANTLLTFVAALAMMVAIDARLTLLSLIPLPFVSISVKVLRQRHSPRFEQIQAQLVRGQRRRAGGAVGRPRRARLPAGGRPRSSGSGARTRSCFAAIGG